MNIVNEI